MRGKNYEEKVAQILSEKGCSILERNYRSCFGEIDILAYYRRKYIVVEVKGSKSSKAAHPVERIDCKKLKRLLLTWKHYVAKKKLDETTEVIFLGATVVDGKIKFHPINFEDCYGLSDLIG